MKSVIKFSKYFAIVCFFYLFSYITFILFAMAKHVAIYCVPVILLLSITIYWFTVGIIEPKNLPFFKTENRLLVIVSTILFSTTIIGIACVVEVRFYKRDPIPNMLLNGYKVFYIAKQINPLEQRFKKFPVHEKNLENP